jgi:hypothetical protein
LLIGDGSYDWSLDQAQINILVEAKALGANIFEAFSNSRKFFLIFIFSAVLDDNHK